MAFFSGLEAFYKVTSNGLSTGTCIIAGICAGGRVSHEHEGIAEPSDALTSEATAGWISAGSSGLPVDIVDRIEAAFDSLGDGKQ